MLQISYFWRLLSFCMSFFCFIAAQNVANEGMFDRPVILVSVAPYKYFVEKIVGDSADVVLMVPAGVSAHTFEPSPKQMIRASTAAIWFTIGESFEKKASAALRSTDPYMQLIDLKKGVDAIPADDMHGNKGCCNSSVDLHFWLSPRVVMVQSQAISEALSRTYPQHEMLFQKNYQILKSELEVLDQKIAEILKPLKQRVILVSHPAYAYFCRDYNLKQYPIEVEGKDPSPRQVTQLLKLARSLSIKKIFVQPQYGNKAAGLVAKDLGAQIVVLDPYSENYVPEMRKIAEAFAQQ